MTKISPFITCTGLDEQTDLDKVNLLAIPGVEFAVLLSENPEGRNRYPSLHYIKYVADILTDRLAVHICGQTARKCLLSSDYDKLLEPVARIQVNGKVTTDELVWITKHFPHHQIITQEAGTPQTYLDPNEMTENHMILVDASGGRGKSPDEWFAPKTIKKVGFAGGLGPDNLATEILRINEVSRNGWWIDMESKLRNENDWLSLEKCVQVINISKETTPKRFK